MRIGIVGAGNVALGLARFWQKGNHHLFFSYSSDMAKLRASTQAVSPASKIGTPAEAAVFGEVVVLAVPWTAVPDALRQCGDLRGKIVLSTVNALNPDMSGLAVGTTTSAAEEIAKLAPGAAVVSAIPSFAELLATGSTAVNGQIGTVFVCGNDSSAKKVSGNLLAETGVEVVDAGPLSSARYVEPAMFLLVQLAYAQGMGGKIAFKLLRS
jgi:8-hydroxy-5-deazaflavin:NADPH oxidoreductase